MEQTGLFTLDAIFLLHERKLHVKRLQNFLRAVKIGAEISDVSALYDLSRNLKARKVVV